MKRVLGKGLEALIPGAETEISETPGISIIKEIPVSKIKPSPFQPRLRFDEAGLDELARSIEAKGIIQPIVVRAIDDSYELLVGERRLRAVERLGRDKIPAVVREQVSNEEAMELTLVENIQREDLNPVEEARAYYRLITECNLKQEDVAARVGKDRSSIANAVRLLSLPERVQTMLSEGKISAGHARALLALPADSEKISLAEKIFSEGLSVRDVERRVSADKRVRKTRIARPLPVELVALEEKLRRKLATKVQINRRRRGGRILIEYYSDDELERLLEILGVAGKH
jgi:ParB family chromosome partitioning protein